MTEASGPTRSARRSGRRRPRRASRPASLGVDAGRLEHRRSPRRDGADQPGQGRAQHLAPLAERGVHHARRPARGSRWSAAARRRMIETRPDVDVRHRPEHRRRTPCRPGPPRRTRPSSPTGCRRPSSPGGAASRSATSACTITNPRDQRVEGGEQVQQHRHRDVVGQVGHHRGRGGAAARSTPHRVSGDHVEPAGPRPASARRPSRPARRPAAASISTAITRSATSSRPRVSEPRPGPISSTTSSGPTPEAATIRRTVLASTTKFCPRCLVGRSSSRAASSRPTTGESRLHRRAAEPQSPPRAGQRSAKTQLRGAGGPGAPALAGLDLLGDRDLRARGWRCSACRDRRTRARCPARTAGRRRSRCRC